MKRCLSLLSLISLRAAAQPGISEMQQAKQDISQSFFSARDASLVLAAVMGLFGAVRIYHNWQMGKERITGEVAAWFFSALFMVLLGAFCQALFGI